jgi:hypothetical protein
MSWPDQSGNNIKQTYIQGFLDISGNSIVRNGNLSVGGNVNISNNLICGNSTPLHYNYLFQTTDNNPNYNIIQIIPTSQFFTSDSLIVNNNNGKLLFKNGTYTASASSSSTTHQSYHALNGSISNTIYWESNSVYNNQVYTGEIETSYDNVKGEWIQIQLPNPTNNKKQFRLTSFSIYSIHNNNSPNEFYFFGSNNISTTVWQPLYYNPPNNNNPFISNNLQTYIVSDQLPYIIFRLVIKSTFGSGSVRINQLNLYGIPYYSSDQSKSIYSNNILFNYGTSKYDLLDSLMSITTDNVNSGLGNGCLYINNSNYLSLPTIHLENTGFSIFFWIKINNNSTSTIYEFNSLSNKLLLIYNNNINALTLKVNANGNENEKNINPILNISNGNWCHIGIIYYTNYVNIYINGIIFQTILDIQYTPDNYVINYIGKSITSSSDHNSNFYMGDFRTYLSSLNSFEINSIYNATTTVNINNVLTYNFKDTYFGSSINVYNDLSLNGNLNIVSGNIFTGTSNSANIFTTNTGIIRIGTSSNNIFVATSGGKTTINNDVSMNGNVSIQRDLSLNGNLNIVSGNIFTGASNSANIFTTNTGIIRIGTSSNNIFVATSGGKTTINNDVSMNGNVSIQRDLSLNGNLNIVSGNIFTGASNSANIFTTNTGTIYFGSSSNNIFVAASGGKTTIHNDVSMNSNVTIQRDLSLNGNLNIVSGNVFTGTSNSANIFTTNTGIIRIGTSSNNIFVAASGGKTTIHNDVSMNGNVSIQRDLSLNGNLNIFQDTFMNGNTCINRDLSLNGNISIQRDLSLNGNLNIVSGNIFTGTSNSANILTTNIGIIRIGTSSNNIFVAASGGKTTINNDVSMNSNVSIQRDLLLNENLNIVSGNVFTGTSNSANIFTTNTGIIRIGTSSNNIFVAASGGKTTINNDISMNGNVSIQRDLSLNGNLNITGKLKIDSINSNTGGNINIYNNIVSTGTLTATTFNATSDYRIKENIRQITCNIDKLNPVQYINKISKNEDIGLIAHELQEIYPFLVTGIKDSDEYQSINYIGLIGILIKEIQDLKKRVSILER